MRNKDIVNDVIRTQNDFHVSLASAFLVDEHFYDILLVQRILTIFRNPDAVVIDAFESYGTERDDPNMLSRALPRGLLLPSRHPRLRLVGKPSQALSPYVT